MLSLLASQMPAPHGTWAPVVLMIVIAIGFAAGNVILSVLIGPSRQGAVKSSTYESGMIPIGDTHKRFNVRFYIVAMIFLVIDVEIVFFYPFATIFAATAKADTLPYAGATITSATAMLISMSIFVLFFLLAYIYAWMKGVFRWD